MYKAGIITLSDLGAKGLRDDTSGAIIKNLLSPSLTILHQTILPDEKERLRQTLLDWSRPCDLILTTGGTGLSVRDITPEVTLSIGEKEIPGISEALRANSLQQTPYAMLSRGVAVMRERCLIINLPGSPKGVTENLTYLLPILPHALDIVTNRKTEH